MYTQGQQQALAQFGLKTAARRGVKIIRDLARTNNLQDLERANRLATTPGVVKNSPTGSVLRFLSKKPTAEGPAALVAHPRHGVSTAVIPDDGGLTTTELLANRRRLSRVDHPSVTKVLGMENYEGINHPVVHREWAPGKMLSQLPADQQEAGMTQIRSLQQAARKKGLLLGDLHGGNVVMRPDGVAKAIDPAPYSINDKKPPFRPTGRETVNIDHVPSWRKSVQDMQDHGNEVRERRPPVAPRTGLDDFARKAEARDAARAPAPQVDEQQRMIEEFLAKKRQAAR